jgi:hypothetical protein
MNLVRETLGGEGALELGPVETADQDAFHQNVSIHGLHYIGLCGVWSESEFGIEGEYLKRIVMIGTDSGGTHSHVANFLALVQTLDRAVGELCLRRDSLGEFASRSRNVEDEPVQDFIGLLHQRSVRIVQDKCKAHGSVRDVGPGQLRRYRPSAAIVNLFGIMPPSSNASVARVSLGFVGVGAEGVCAINPTPASTHIRLAILDLISLSFLWRQLARTAR